MTAGTSHPAHAFGTYARHLCTVQWADLPAHTRHRAVLVLADDLAAACSAVQEPQIVAWRQREADTGSGNCSLFAAGRPRSSAAQAAFHNALAMGWNELDEGYRKAVSHGGLYVLPATLATAEATRQSVKQVLRALILAYDAVTRLARAWPFPRMALHPHAVLAPVGAAAGVGLLRQLSPASFSAAVAGATTLGMCGAFDQATQGILVRNAWAAQGAQAGMNAVALAGWGIAGADHTPDDVYRGALGADFDPTPLDLQATPGWGIDDGYHKMNACCQYAHSAIEAVQSLLHDHPELREGTGIQSITIQAHPLAFRLDDLHPVTTLGAKFSLPHAVAATFVHGHGGVESFDHASLTDERIRSLRTRIRMDSFPDVRPWPDDRPARIIVQSRSGETLQAICWRARGGPDQLFPEPVLWQKIEDLSRDIMPGLADTLRQLGQWVQHDESRAELDQPWAAWLDRIFTGRKDS